MFGIRSTMKEYKKVLSGESGSLSRAEITNMVVVMQKAAECLPADRADRVFKVYQALSGDNEKMTLDANAFRREMNLILLRFDLEADVRTIMASDEMAASWNDSAEKEAMRNSVSALRMRTVPLTAMLENMKKLEAKYKVALSEDPGNAEMVAESTRLTQLIAEKSEELKCTLSDYYAQQRKFYMEDCKENGLVMQDPEVESLLRLEV